MKFIFGALIIILLLLQYRLWFSHDGLPAVLHLNRDVKVEQKNNAILEERNQVLAAEVQDLKSGLEALEERARSGLGMVKEDETFVQIIDDEADK